MFRHALLLHTHTQKKNQQTNKTIKQETVREVLKLSSRPSITESESEFLYLSCKREGFFATDAKREAT